MNNTSESNKIEENLWEEKNCLEQKKNYLNSTDAVQKDIILNTENDLTKKPCENIGKIKKTLNKKQYQREYHKNHYIPKKRVKKTKEEIKNYQKEYYLKNKEKIVIRKKNRYIKNINRIRLQNRIRYHNNKEYYKIYNRMHVNKRRHSDINYKIASNIRTRLYLSVKGIEKIGSAVKDLGCSIEEFKKYIESKFQTGMSWDNWGRHTWHIDHIKPLSKFDLTDKNQFKEAVHYTNLQPLWANENRRKFNK